jgi:hypothetical protein
MTTNRRVRLLIKMPVAAAARASRSLQLAGTDLDLEVLCQNEHLGRPSAALAGGSRWFLAKSKAKAGSAAEAWEVAYEAMRAHPAALAVRSFMSSWTSINHGSIKTPSPGIPNFEPHPGELCVFNDQVAGFGIGPGFARHLRPECSDLATARTTAGAEVGKVRIGILDVGFDLQHKALPEHLRLDLARNFADDGRSPNDVSDRFRPLFA